MKAKTILHDLTFTTSEGTGETKITYMEGGSGPYNPKGSLVKSFTLLNSDTIETLLNSLEGRGA